MRFQPLRWCLVTALCLAAPATAGAQTFVYALEPGPFQIACFTRSCPAPTVHLIDATTARELWTTQVAAVGDKGTALRLSSDGRLLFVTTVRPQTDAGTLWMVDTITRSVLAQVAVGANPSDLAVLPDTSRAFVVNNHSDSVSVVDLTSFTVTATIPLGHFPWRIAMTPAGGAVYVTNAGSASVSKISTATNSVETTIGVGHAPLGLDISPDGSRLFVANSGNATIAVIDAALDSVLRVFPAGSSSRNPPIDVSAPSPTRVFVALDDPNFGSLQPNHSGVVQLLNAADGSIIGSTNTSAGGRFARDGSGSPTYLVAPRGIGAFPSVIYRVANDGASAAAISQSADWSAAAVDPCTFESTVTPAVFGPAGGSGTLTIGVPAGCAWTIDTAAAPGFSVSGGALSSTGPATRTISVSASDAPKLGTLVIGRQTITLELTIPRLNIDYPRGGLPVLQQPFTLSGWAIDQNFGTTASPFRSRGIDFLHVWAYPGSGAPIFLGQVSVFGSRADIAAIFGLNLLKSGFDLEVRSLLPGTYTLAVFAHSEISNRFVAAQTVSVTVARVPSPMVVDTPKPSSTISGAFDVGGWAIDTAATSGPGVDAVHVWAYPTTGAAPTFVGAAAQTSRPDVAAIFGNQFLNSGFHLRGATLPPGTYDLVVFAHSTVTGAFDNSKVVRITVQ